MKVAFSIVILGASLSTVSSYSQRLHSKKPSQQVVDEVEELDRNPLGDLPSTLADEVKALAAETEETLSSLTPKLPKIGRGKPKKAPKQAPKRAKEIAKAPKREREIGGEVKTARKLKRREEIANYTGEWTGNISPEEAASAWPAKEEEEEEDRNATGDLHLSCFDEKCRLKKTLDVHKKVIKKLKTELTTYELCPSKLEAIETESNEVWEQLAGNVPNVTGETQDLEKREMKDAIMAERKELSGLVDKMAGRDTIESLKQKLGFTDMRIRRLTQEIDQHQRANFKLESRLNTLKRERDHPWGTPGEKK